MSYYLPTYLPTFFTFLFTSELVKNANQWLLNHIGYAVNTCESIELKARDRVGIDSEKVTFLEYSGSTLFVRGLR